MSRTYPAYAEPCGWNAMLPSRRPRAAARGAISVKYAVVGAGFTGLAAARRLLELDPGAEIAVLEASTVGEGSSARNSGFLNITDIPDGTSPEALATSEARNRYITEGFTHLRDLVVRHAIDCDLHRCGRIKAAATERGAKAVGELERIVATLGLAHERLDRTRLMQRTGTAYYDRGLFTEEGYLVQPAALVRGLADALPETIRLYEQSPVVRLTRSGKWQLETADARIIADVVIMAANSSIKSFGYLRDRLVTIYTYAAITHPVPQADIAALGAMPSWGLLPAHRLGTTLRRVGRDRLLVRSLYAYERPIDPGTARDALLARFHRRYPGLAHVDLEHCWGGTTALTMNGAPYWGRLDDGLYVSAGCNGSGIVKGTVLGLRLADLAAGRDVGPTTLAAYGTASWIAPEPFRTVGFHVVSAIERRKAGLES